MPDPRNAEPTMQLQAEQQKTSAAEAAQDFLQSILDTGREPFLVLDAALNVVTANRAFFRTFATDAGATLGRFVYDLGDGQWDIPALRRLLDDVLPREEAFEGFEVTHDFPGVGTKTFRLNGRKLYRPGNHTRMVLLALEDVTARRRAEAARREAEERYQLLVEGARDYAMILMDADGCIQSWNAGASRIFGHGEDEVLGLPAALIFTPEDRAAGAPQREQARAASEGRALDVRWHLRKDGTRFWADGVLEALRFPDGGLRGFAKILRDASERKEAEEARDRAEEARGQAAQALRAAGDRAADILESITDAFFALDRQWRFTYVNAQAERLLQRPRAALLGGVAWEEFPEALGGALDRHLRRAVSQRAAVSFEEYYAPLGAWLEVRAFPSPDGLSVFLQDAGARHRAEEARREAEAALETERTRLAATLEQMPSGVAIAEAPSGRLVFHNGEAARLLGHPLAEGAIDWGAYGAVRADGTPYRAEEYPLARAAATGEVVSGEEMTYRRGDGRLTTLSVNAGPLRDAAGRVFGAVVSFHDIAAQKRAEEQQRRRAEREALLNRIGAAIRASDDPDEIQLAAVSALGAALGADRCYFTQYRLPQESAEISTEFCRPGLPPLARSYALSEHPTLAGDLLGEAGAHVVRDARGADFDPRTVALLDSVRLRSFIRLPLRERGTLTASLVVGMADAPRAWTADEVALAEAVATQARTAVADARVRLREHRIATQLQDALQPPLPAAVPGLAVQKYYEAALDEAGVGGDFYDVFPVGPARTALVVGDLSGKGLAAAAQVSTVRNMLRATLYLGRTVAEAVTQLNDILADNELLSGFATLFVGVYDSEDRRLRYVNCGQEPGLVRRAGGGPVESLPPTGPVLGTFPDASFLQAEAALSPGDALALFTDGLTEAGPSRTDMLNVEGVADLLAAAPAGDGGAAQRAEDLVLSLIAGVDRYAQAGVRDDVCLLIAVAV